MPQLVMKNKKATFNYEVLDRYTAGLVLRGFEVKSLKQKHGSFEGSYVSNQDGEMWLGNFYIPPYQPANTPESYDPYQRRKLLLNKKEIEEITRKGREAGLTTIPTAIVLENNKVKVEIALARGKKKHDKRESINRRELEREMGRKMK